MWNQSANKRSSVGAITSSGSLRDGLEITVKCHVREGESRPIPFKNGLSVRFGSDDSGTPRDHRDGKEPGFRLLPRFGEQAPLQSADKDERAGARRHSASASSTASWSRPLEPDTCMLPWIPMKSNPCLPPKSAQLPWPKPIPWLFEVEHDRAHTANYLGMSVPIDTLFAVHPRAARGRWQLLTILYHELPTRKRTPSTKTSYEIQVGGRACSRHDGDVVPLAGIRWSLM
jgi:hypothetical protein